MIVVDCSNSSEVRDVSRQSGRFSVEQSSIVPLEVIGKQVADDELGLLAQLEMRDNREPEDGTQRAEPWPA